MCFGVKGAPCFGHHILRVSNRHTCHTRHTHHTHHTRHRREARTQLLEVHAAMVKAGGAGSRKLIQILTLLVGVLLELGLLIEAEKYSKLVRVLNVDIRIVLI